MSKSGKEYKIEKKKDYVFNDYVNVTVHFNKLFIEFMEELCAICVEKKWRKEVDEIKSYICTIEVAIGANKFIVAQTFARTAYLYYNFILKKDENILLNNDYSKLVSNDKMSVMSILNYKKLWADSGELNKEYIFQSLIHLCSIIEHYEEVGFSLRIINKTNTPYSL